MTQKINRRSFIIKGSQVCVAGCLFAGSNISAMANFLEEDSIDPKSLNYCGYKCPSDCKFLQGTIENNIELKKQAYKDWEIEERMGIEFNADDIFCYGCKTLDKPAGVVLTHCTVRSCAIEKRHDSCVQCDELVSCEKELWDRFPEFKKAVIEMQQKYKASV